MLWSMNLFSVKKCTKNCRCSIKQQMSFYGSTLIRIDQLPKRKGKIEYYKVILYFIIKLLSKNTRSSYFRIPWTGMSNPRKLSLTHDVVFRIDFRRMYTYKFSSREKRKTLDRHAVKFSIKLGVSSLSVTSRFSVTDFSPPAHFNNWPEMG